MHQTILLLTILLCSVVAIQAESLELVNNSIDGDTVTQLDKLWDDSKVSGDFEKPCSYRKPDAPSPFLTGDANDLTSTWQDRQILFRSSVGSLLPGLTHPISLQYYLTNSITHVSGTTRVHGGCKWGTGVDPTSRWQMKGNALYDIEEPKKFSADPLYRGHMTTATVSLTEWFAWHSQHGGKYALKMSYVEHIHNPNLPIPAKWGKYQRYSTDLTCALYYRPAGQRQKAVLVEKERWSAYVHLLSERGHEKRLLTPCPT